MTFRNLFLTSALIACTVPAFAQDAQAPVAPDPIALQQQLDATKAALDSKQVEFDTVKAAAETALATAKDYREARDINAKERDGWKAATTCALMNPAVQHSCWVDVIVNNPNTDGAKTAATQAKHTGQAVVFFPPPPPNYGSEPPTMASSDTLTSNETIVPQPHRRSSVHTVSQPTPAGMRKRVVVKANKAAPVTVQVNIGRD